MVCGSADDASYQDLAEHPRALTQNGVRWTASVPGPVTVSQYGQTFSYNLSGPAERNPLHAADEPITTGSVSTRPFDATVQRVIRARKGDLLTSRPPQAAVEQGIPNSGTVWKMKDIFSSYQDGDLPKVALAPAGNEPAETIMLAYNTFLMPDRIEEHANILVAKAEPKAVPAVQTGPEFMTAGVSYVAYAPAAVDASTPFGLLFDSGTSRAAKPFPMPRIRPVKVDVARYMSGHGPQRRRPGDHEWAANKLPAHVYKSAQQACLARGIYFEARGEPVRGQAAVGQVILNRVKNPAYPSTICGRRLPEQEMAKPLPVLLCL